MSARSSRIGSPGTWSRSDTSRARATALQALRDIQYARWREYDSADTVRFCALRLHEAGIVKSSPQRIIAQSTDWRFLNELKKELKG